MSETKKDLKLALEDWEQNERQPYIKKNPERRKVYKNDLGHAIKPLYTPLDLEERGFTYEKDLGFPGQLPQTRGHNPNMLRSDFFRAGVYSGYGIAEVCRERYEKIASWGADEIDMAWDLPTQIGFDSDNIMSTGEVGRTGVAVDSLQDLEILFADFDFRKLKNISLLANSMGPLGVAYLVNIGRKRGLEPKDFQAFMQNDPLKEYAARGTYIYPVKPSVRLACDVIEWSINNAPHWKTIKFCANHFNAAGAGSANASAFAMANGFVYIDELISRGYTIEQIVPHARIHVDEREDFFTMVALGRATHKAWSIMMRKRYGAAEDSPALNIGLLGYSHGGETLQEPINNVLRIGFSALGYYLGGVTDISNAGYDEAMGLTTDRTSKVSLRTNQIINNELGFGKVIDPLAGSYYVESLTMDMCNEILAQLEKIEKDYGNSIAALDAGYLHGVISKGAIRRQDEFESKERVFTSLNIYPTDEELPRGAFKIDPTNEKHQIERLKKLRETRDNEKVRAALEKLDNVTRAGENVVEATIEAVAAYATHGEICDVWRNIFGEYRSMTTF